MAAVNKEEKIRGGQADFLEGVSALLKIAETNGNHLKMSEITEYFSDMAFETEQFDFICRYLESKQVIIENRVQRGEDDAMEEPVETKQDPQDADMVRIYTEEIQKARSISSDQEEKLVKKVIIGDENARHLLIEANLSFAAKMAEEFEGQGMLLSDLIQECNIGLMLAVNEFEPSMHGNFVSFKEKVIRAHMEQVLKEYNSPARAARKMASRVNELNDLATSFAREYEREATPLELAQRMGISEQEVRDLMKVSLDAIEVYEE